MFQNGYTLLRVLMTVWISCCWQTRSTCCIPANVMCKQVRWTLSRIWFYCSHVV